MSAEAVVLNKVFGILRKELSAEEYVTYLQMVTPRIGDVTKELREKTKDLSLEGIIKGAKKIEKKGAVEVKAKIIVLGVVLFFLLSATVGMTPALSNAGGREMR